MHSTLRNSALAAAAALVVGLAGGCAAAGPASTKAMAAGNDQPSVKAATTTPAAAAAPQTSTPPTTPANTPSTRAAAPANSTNSGVNASLAAAGVPCEATAVACVSLSKQEAWLLHDGKVVYGPVPVATGRASLPTPAGIFQVQDKVRDSWSKPYQSWMPWAVYFNGGDAFHEDPVDVRSHGCVHLGSSNAEYFYNYLQVGNEVQVAH